MPRPDLTFFTELDSEALSTLFEDKTILEKLLTLEASLSLGILDLSDQRAEVVKQLNAAGIPVIGWLLLPEEDGYWFNIDNYEKAAARYISFKAWTRKHNLQWAGVGLDIEMNINDLRQVMARHQADKFVATLFQRYLNKNRVTRARRVYQALVNVIRSDGYPVESYHLPIIEEERRGRSTVLQRTLGLVDVQADREVLMLYSSFLRPDGAAVLWSYAPNADSIGVGNTGGGVDVEGVIDLEPLSWEEFSRDLRLCVMRNKPVHIFCLEGCVAQGFLSKLEDFDWDKPVPIPERVNKVKMLRTGGAALLWLLERPWVILLTLATFIGLGFLFKRSQKD